MERYESLDQSDVSEQCRQFRAAPITPVSILSERTILHRMEMMCMNIQNDFISNIERLESSGKNFQVDEYKRPNNTGGGITMVLQDGVVFEKSGVGVSVVHGNLTPGQQTAMRSRGHKLTTTNEGDSLPFSVVGVSCVTHPTNPHCPTLHFNYRYFEVTTANGVEAWFGGGTDLTPSYLNDEDIIHFHSMQKRACDQSGEKVHSKFKKWCDDYFRVNHRGPSGECRGVGGIFFDDINGDFDDVGQADYERGFRHQMLCGSSICDSYFPIIERRKDKEFTEYEKEWQQIRRGRYVEFNLVYDRGTKFGFATPGVRIESVLMSLPLTARWEYQNDPAEGTDEWKALQVFRNPVDWI